MSNHKRGYEVKYRLIAVPVELDARLVATSKRYKTSMTAVTVAALDAALRDEPVVEEVVDVK
jgi:hypothetical protein